MAAKPEKMPEAVVEAIKRFASQHDLSAVDLLSPSVLKWDAVNGCYYFIRSSADGNQVYHGVELNGYIHT